MRPVLLASLLLLGGCAKSRDAPAPVAPRPPLANTTDAGVPVADASDSAEIGELLNNPDIPLEERLRMLQVLLSPSEHGPPDLANATPSHDMTPEPIPTSPDISNADGADVRPPIAADLAEYTRDIAGSGMLSTTIETSMGALHCALYADKAPLAVANFIGLATGKKPWLNPRTGQTETGKPFYDGLIFHRVIPGLGIQGGDPFGIGVGGAGYQFVDEVNNGLTMRPGTLMMANAGSNTNGSQFFITEGSPGHLNNRHTIFGLCKEVGLVKKIGRVPTDAFQRPQTPVMINKISFSKR